MNAPVDIWVIICQHLDVQNAIRVSLSCKSLYKAIQTSSPLWRHFYSQTLASETNIADMFRDYKAKMKHLWRSVEGRKLKSKVLCSFRSPNFRTKEEWLSSMTRVQHIFSYLITRYLYWTKLPLFYPKRFTGEYALNHENRGGKSALRFARIRREKIHSIERLMQAKCACYQFKDVKYPNYIINSKLWVIESITFGLASRVTFNFPYNFPISTETLQVNNGFRNGLYQVNFP